jgi:hypothetical protein
VKGDVGGELHPREHQGVEVFHGEVLLDACLGVKSILVA